MTGHKVPSFGLYANIAMSLQQGVNLYGHRQPSPSLPSVPTTTTTPATTRISDQDAAARRATYRALPDKGARAGEIIGWRAWLIGNTGQGKFSRAWLIGNTDQGKFRLRSLTQDVYWEPNEPVHGDPDLGYGVFAYNDPLMLGLMAQAEYSHSQLAFGSIYLWGAVVEHDHGYRAEWAKIRSIDYYTHASNCTNISNSQLVQTLRLAYGVKSNKELLCQTNQAIK